MDDRVPKEVLEVPDYSVRKKVIWKGKMAPKGYKYLAVRVKSKLKIFDSVRLIPSDLEDKYVEELAGLMRKSLKEKYWY